MDYQPLYGVSDLPNYSAAPADESFSPGSDPFQRMGAILQTSLKAAWYSGNTNASDIAHYDAAAARIEKIKKITGADIRNPYLAPPLTGYEDLDTNAHPDDRATFDSYQKDHPEIGGGFNVGNPMVFDKAITPYRERQLQNRLNQLASDFPQHADLIAPNRSVETDARSLAAGAVTNASRAYDQGPGYGLSFLASLGGGLAGSLRDPVQVMALGIGGGKIKAVSTLGRIAEGALRQGAVNTGVAVAMHPLGVEWKKQIGLEAGILPSAEELGMAFLFGAIPGGAVPAFKAAFKNFKVDGSNLTTTVQKAVQGDAQAMADIAKVIPKEYAPELHAAVESHALDQAAIGKFPEGLQREAVIRQLHDGIRFAEDPLNNPLPEILGGKAGVTDRLALDALYSSLPEQSIQVLRRSAEFIDSALSSDQPHVRTLGRLASLSDEALAMVERGEIPPAHAQHVPGLVQNEAEHAAVLQMLQLQKPTSEDIARKMITQRLDVQNQAAAQNAILGHPVPDKVPNAIHSPSTSIELEQQIRSLQRELGAKSDLAEDVAQAAMFKSLARGAVDKPVSLIQFLKNKGGIKDYRGEFKRYIKEHPGLVNNKRGMHADMAQQAAEEAGYLYRYSDQLNLSTTSINDLHAAIEAHPSYSFQDRERLEAYENKIMMKKQNEEFLYRVDQHKNNIRKEVEAFEGKIHPGDEYLLRQAAKIHMQYGVSYIDAYERAIMQDVLHSDEARAIMQSRHGKEGLVQYEQDIPFDIHPDDVARQKPTIYDGPGAIELRGEFRAGGDGNAQPGSSGANEAPRRNLSGNGGPQNAKLNNSHYDTVPISELADGSDMKAVPRAQILSEQPREFHLADLVEACKF